MPSSFVMLGSLPLTPSGKLDRRALLVRGYGRRELEGAYAAPCTEVEQIITDVWRDVLNIAQVGIHDNFFDLGGDSLLITQIRSRLEVLLNRQLSIVDLFRYPTVSSLAQFVGRGEVQTDSFQAAQDRARKQLEAVSQLRRQMK